jgi:hypothetical protein
MKLMLSFGFTLLFAATGFAESDTIVDSLKEKSITITDTSYNQNTGNKEEDISYPPKQPETKISDIVKAAKGLRDEVQSLDTAMVNDVKREGLLPSIRKHRKFYFSVGLFVVLFLVWLKTRDKRR